MENKQNINMKVTSGQDMEEKKKKKKKIILIILGVIVGIAIIIALIFALQYWLDPNARYGSYNGKTQEEIVADLNRQVKDNEMYVSIANVVKFPNGSQEEGIANIENIQANHMDQKVRIELDGETVYESDAIAPGYYIEKIKLNKYLEPGNYKAVAYFTGYNHDTHKMIGSLASDINLEIS